MKAFLVTTLFIVSVAICCLGAVLVTPYYYYGQVLKGTHSSQWFNITNFRKSILTPQPIVDLIKSKTKNENLWKKFQFGDLKIPLPVKNPFYFVTPKLKYNSSAKRTDFGVAINNAEGRSLVDVYYLPNQSFPNFLSNQDLFQLPLIEQQINEKTDDKIWEDVFTKHLGEWNIPFSQMAYNLYLLEFRSRIMGKSIRSFGYYPDRKMAFMELDFYNKDYKNELILAKKGNQIFSFILFTAVDNPEASLLRYKLIDEIEYLQSSPTLTDFIYQEYKALNYADKIDHLGMLYLLSAWSHSPSRVNILQEAIGSLERGYRNQKVLESLYLYTYKRFGKVFSTRKVEGVNLPQEVLLRRNIEIEKREKEEKRLLDKENFKPAPVQTTVEEDYESIIKKAKKIKRIKGTIQVD